MKNFEEIKKEIENIIISYDGKNELPHAIGTLNWVLKIRPDADDALKISAFAHDIERCVVKHEKSSDYLIVNEFDKYQILKQEHADKGAEIVVNILGKYDVSEAEKQRVKYLISHHEVGGNNDADVLCDADSLSYLLDNFIGYLDKYGTDRAKVKLEWMYGRMSERGKELGLEFYNEALRKLGDSG
ncbi:MAG: DUF4202 family protein [Candidatus Magasanikbacteria bacterium]